MNLHRELIDRFRAIHGITPLVVAEVPGRVNLIGEHIDYEGYGVLPMAIQQDCKVAIAVSPQHGIHLTNTEPALYPSINIQQPEDMSSCSHSWQKYFVAAYKGAKEFAGRLGLAASLSPGLYVMVTSGIPPGAGLSSSSALVVASALALLSIWGIPASRQEVAELTCRCERYVGTEGGGMDQAISLLAQEGVAMMVDFNPVRSVPVSIPEGAAFVVAHSLAPSLKAHTAAARYNLRVVECRLAAALLAKQLGGTSTDVLAAHTLKQVEHLVYARAAAAAAEMASSYGSAAAEAVKVIEQLESEAALLAPWQSLVHRMVVRTATQTAERAIAMEEVAEAATRSAGAVGRGGAGAPLNGALDLADLSPEEAADRLLAGLEEGPLCRVLREAISNPWYSAKELSVLLGVPLEELLKGSARALEVLAAAAHAAAAEAVAGAAPAGAGAVPSPAAGGGRGGASSSAAADQCGEGAGPSSLQSRGGDGQEGQQQQKQQQQPAGVRRDASPSLSVSAEATPPSRPSAAAAAGGCLAGAGSSRQGLGSEPGPGPGPGSCSPSAGSPAGTPALAAAAAAGDPAAAAGATCGSRSRTPPTSSEPVGPGPGSGAAAAEAGGAGGAGCASSGRFVLQPRALHVFTEAARVQRFKQICEADCLTPKQKLAGLGQLMDASHSSCQVLYECSCEELDQLVGVARAAGALGARLTGAGWGGCVVALVEQEQVQAFLQQLQEQYYEPAVRAGKLAAGEVVLGRYLFTSRPAAGASVVSLGPAACAPWELKQQQQQQQLGEQPEHAQGTY